ncbi:MULTISPECIES: hypothetical protein [unclassified Mycobacterium]|uniref:hypothetical protein n=1 Tax=unclassified Mycobacterium TaxID=2642494 RepID=UPI0029C94E86|nr:MULTISPECIES: hypothetical protein [unclassified Mycobacterium]
MDTSNFTARPVGKGRFARAALLAGAIAIGASAFGHTAIASAEWDIEAYDRCITLNQVLHKAPVEDLYCCLNSGGNISEHTGNCVAPPANNIHNIPLGPKLGSITQPITPTGTPVS